MSAFPESGRSIHSKTDENKGRFRPMLLKKSVPEVRVFLFAF